MVDCVRGFRCCLFGRHFFGLFFFLRRRHFNCSPPHSPRFPVKHFDFCRKRRPYSFIFPKPTEAKKMHKIICMRSFEMRNSREMGGRRKWGKNIRSLKRGVRDLSKGCFFVAFRINQLSPKWGKNVGETEGFDSSRRLRCFV